MRGGSRCTGLDPAVRRAGQELVVRFQTALGGRTICAGGLAMSPELRAAIEALIARAERLAHLDDDDTVLVPIGELRRLAAAAEPPRDAKP